jgi:acyl transferase domain-containing protein/surfactin synthase thioesterase subunit
MLTKAKDKEELSLLVRSLNAIEVLQKELRQKKKREQETIAVIGMACRFPGGSVTPEEYWRFLMGNDDGMIVVPADRWNHMDFYDHNLDAKGKAYVKEAGFLQQDISLFDAAFFGISPREAEDMDPQQRLLLETVWEALERACLQPDKLKGSKTGVFIGIIGSDFATLPRDHNEMSLYAATGSLANIASGRLAYVLGLQGPAVSVDTACSSSLVATHLACESLLNGESDLAISGGVGLMLSPYPFVALCSLKALAKDGRCKPFDAMGDGYGRGEGCGLVVLKRMSDAVEDGDQVLAVIKGSAVNNDGPASGLTVPNGQAQKAVIRQALNNAGLRPDDISFLEAHGTGTALGDPIEIQAMTEVFGNKKGRERPLMIGTAKGHIGHLEAAAGIASLIKVVLSINHKKIPPTLNLTQMNPRIRLDQIPAQVPQQPQNWNTPPHRMRIAGISSFGFSGTNAHVIVAEAPASANKSLPKRDSDQEALQILSLSAHSETALKELAQKYLGYFDENRDKTLSAICYSANAGRRHFSKRMAVIGENLNDFRSKLKEYLVSDNQPLGPEESHIFVSGGNDINKRPKIAFLFSGEPDLIIAETKQLYDNEPAFREAFDQCNNLFRPYLNGNLSDDFSAKKGNGDGQSEIFRECRLFAIEYSLGRLWESWGIKPDAVFGQKTGEIAAACMGGIMSLKTACGLVAGTDSLSAKDLRRPHIRFVSGVTGGPVSNREIVSVRYWNGTNNVDVDWKKGLAYLNSKEYRIWLGINLNDRFVAEIKSDLPQEENYYFPLPLHENLRKRLMQTLAQIYCLGAKVNWDVFYSEKALQKEVLPTYPFERKRFWIEKLPFKSDAAIVNSKRKKEAPTGSRPDNIDPLEGGELFIPFEKKIFRYRFSRQRLPELSDTKGVLHVGFYQEMLNRVMQRLYRTNSYTVAETEYLLALYIPDKEDKDLQLIMDQGEDGEVRFQFFSYNEHANSWLLHVQGTIERTEPDLRPTFPSVLFDEIIARCKSEYSGLMFYQMLNECGIRLGPSVQWIEQLWYNKREVLARLRLPLESESKTAYGLGVSPGVHDACAQLFYNFLPKTTTSDMKFMVSHWKNFVFNLNNRSDLIWCHVRLEKLALEEGHMKGSYSLYDGAGRPLACLNECRMKAIDRRQEEAMKRAIQQIQTISRGDKDEVLLRKLKTATDTKQKQILQNYLHESIAKTLKTSVNELSTSKSLLEIGMDSLVGFEFKAKIENALDISLPGQVLIAGPSIEDLAGEILLILGFVNLPNEPKPLDENAIWFFNRKRSAKSKFCLYCLPPGGLGASIFSTWSDDLSDYIEVCPIQMPGKETRLEEEPIANINSVIEAIENVLLADIAGPYGFFGHSMGALIAYRLAVKLSQTAPIRPQHLFVAAYSSPQFDPNPFLKKVIEWFKAEGFTGIPEATDVGSLDPDKLRKILCNVYPGALEISQEMLGQMLPFLLADVKIVESYRYKPEPNFEVPITAFHAEDDPIVNELEMRAWKEITSSSFKLHVMAGNHLFLKNEQERTKLLNHIAKDIKTDPRNNFNYVG